MLGASLLFCLHGRPLTATPARLGAAIAPALIPVAVVTLGVLFVNEPFRHPAPGPDRAALACFILCLAQLGLLPTAFVLAATGEASGAGTIVAAIVTLAGLALETFVALLASGQMLAGASL